MGCSVSHPWQVVGSPSSGVYKIWLNKATADLVPCRWPTILLWEEDSSGPIQAAHLSSMWLWKSCVTPLRPSAFPLGLALCSCTPEHASKRSSVAGLFLLFTLSRKNRCWVYVALQLILASHLKKKPKNQTKPKNPNTHTYTQNPSKCIYCISIEKVGDLIECFCDIRFAFRKLRYSGRWHTWICVRVWFTQSCCSKFSNMEQPGCFCFCFFNRHSYTNLKIVNWSKVSIADPDVKKYIDRK